MEMDNDGIPVSKPGKSFSIPGFLRKIFTKKELGDNDKSLNHRILAKAVCAVLLESGFLEIDPVSKTIMQGNVSNFDIQQNWHLASFHFAHSDLIASGNTETVKIQFLYLGNFCRVYGSLANGIRHSVFFDQVKLVPFLNVVWDNRDSTIKPEKQVCEFWIKTKDGLVVPLLIDLCDKTGVELELPTCFIQLPTELKLQILDSVSGVEVAKVSCECSELRYLVSSDQLWKQKFVAEFGDYSGSGCEGDFKERFASIWEWRKKDKGL